MRLAWPGGWPLTNKGAFHHRVEYPQEVEEESAPATLLVIPPPSQSVIAASSTSAEIASNGGSRLSKPANFGAYSREIPTVKLGKFPVDTVSSNIYTR